MRFSVNLGSQSVGSQLEDLSTDGEGPHVPASAAIREGMSVDRQRYHHVSSTSSSRQAATGQHVHPPESAGRHPAARTTSLWQKWTHASLFAFQNDALEASFHNYMEHRWDLGTLAVPCFILAGWIMFVSHCLASPQEVRALLPQGWPMTVLHALLAMMFLSLQVMQPHMYIKHKKAVHAGIHLVFIATFCHARELLLWLRMSRSGQHIAGHVALVRAFLAENLYLSTSWLGPVSLCVGQVIDLLMVALFLLIGIRSNDSFCASTAWDGSPLGTTGYRLAEAACAPVRAWAGLPAPTPLQLPLDPSACSASLMFWQVLGAVFACAVVLVKDVWQRQAFLRSNIARALIPLEHRATSEAWPFSGSLGVALVLWVSMCVAMVPYLLQLAASNCLALAKRSSLNV